MQKILFVLLILSTVSLFAQPVTREELAEELRRCDQALQESQQRIQILSKALNASDSLMMRHQGATDSLISNLANRLSLQDTITTLMKVNSDTLQAMVQDYKLKLAEINDLYVGELQKQTRPWILTSNGLTGLGYGILVGAALGVTFALLK